MMIINFRKHDRVIDEKEAQIEQLTQELHKKVAEDRKTLGKLNKALSNGVTLQIYKATHGGHHAK